MLAILGQHQSGDVPGVLPDWDLSHLFSGLHIDNGHGVLACVGNVDFLAVGSKRKPLGSVPGWSASQELKVGQRVDKYSAVSDAAYPQCLAVRGHGDSMGAIPNFKFFSCETTVPTGNSILFSSARITKSTTANPLA